MSNEPEEIKVRILPPNKAIAISDAFNAWGVARAETEDNSGFAVELTAKILNATSVEEMMAADEMDDTPSTEDMVDKEISIISFSCILGDYEESRYDFFMAVHAAYLANGEEVVFTTGAEHVMPKFKFLEEHDALPYDGVIREIKSKKGYTVYKFKDIPARAVKGSRA